MNLRPTVIAAPRKSSVLQKELVARLQSRVSPVYLVNEYPKSGGTWLKFMLSEALNYKAWTKGKPVWGPCVMQAHWNTDKGKCRTVALFRDGRDVMVSFYYYSFFVNDLENARLVRIMREKFQFKDYRDVRANLPEFMKVMMDSPVTPTFSWPEFVQEWADRPEVTRCRYEDLRSDTAGELSRVFLSLTGRTLDRYRADRIAEAYSLGNMRKRKRELNPGLKRQEGAEMSFFRKGIAGGWSEYFTDEALNWFESRAGSQLVKLGYSLGRPGDREDSE